MKRLTIGLTATAIITLGVFVFLGCEKEENKKTTTKEYSIIKSTINFNNMSANDYGQLHNDVCEYIICNYSNRFFDTNRPIDLAEIIFYMDKGIEYLVQNNALTAINATQLLQNLTGIANTIGEDSSGCFAMQSFLESATFNDFYNLMSGLGYSLDFSSLLYPCIEALQQNPQLPWENIERDFLQPISDATLSNPEEQFVKDIFVSICCYSAWFWNEEIPSICAAQDPPRPQDKPRNPDLPRWVKDCSEWTIIMDGLGGILGLPFGGAGSAAMGPTLSIAAKRNCEAGGKYK